ncbi:MAG: sulfatase-like hydrolase/transferase, partial [Candidatus Izemoplasmataceae bacterium]
EHADHIRLLLELDGRDEVDESIVYYHAAQWEFDLAIGYLMDYLEQENVLDDTVIVIFGDHYAYGLDRDVIWDYDTVKNPETMLNIHNVPLVIYTPGLEAQSFDNFFATVDLLPTLSNMFNLNLNYQQIMGEDAFNSVQNTILFSSTSFLTESYYYEVERDIFRYFGSEDEPTVDYRPYIGQMFHRINVNNYVLNNDYFSEFYGTREFIIEIFNYKDERYFWPD